MTEYRYRGARAAVLLHEKQMRRFLDTWKAAKRANLVHPTVEDPDYSSLDTLLAHVYRWAGTYLTWMCEKLDLAPPVIEPLPDASVLQAEADHHLDRLLAAWRHPLSEVPVARFIRESHPAPWGVPYCIDSMLDHAVTHPLKHRFQLEEWMAVDHEDRNSGGHP